MPAKRSRANRLAVVSASHKSARALSGVIEAAATAGRVILRSAVSTKKPTSGNEYLCAIEKNQNGKYNIRVRAVFGHDAWTLPVYFLASSFNAAMKKLEESLQLLQKNEERLQFWCVERTDDLNVAADHLQEFGLGLDRRRDFPRKVAKISVVRERSVPASMLAPLRRVLADSVSQERVSVATAGD
jgi:hypothetical protein